MKKIQEPVFPLFVANMTTEVRRVVPQGAEPDSKGLLVSIEENQIGGTTIAQTQRRCTISVVVPTLNEARNLPYAFAGLPADIHEVIVVDGRSNDDTETVAKILRADVRVIRETTKGKGAALKAGFASATGDIIVMLDADGSADPQEIRRFVAALLDGADFAKGSRFIAGGGSSDITGIRRLGNMGLNLIVNTLFGTRYSDLCYGYNAFWRYCLPVLDVDCTGFEVETLLNIRAARAKLRVVEVPSFEHERVHGTSNLHAVKDGLRVVRTICTEWWSSMRHPSRPVSRTALLANTAERRAQANDSTRLCIVGPSTKMLSGITYYTYGLINEMSSRHEVSALLLRQLLPTRLYPGSDRVGKDISSLKIRKEIPVYDGLDWSWGRSMVGAVKFLRDERPDVIVLQWWTGAVLHSYLALAIVAKRMGIRVVVEVHESQDTGEAQIGWVERYVKHFAPHLFNMANTVFVHSDFDRELMITTFGLPADKLKIVPIAMYGVSGSADGSVTSGRSTQARSGSTEIVPGHMGAGEAGTPSPHIDRSVNLLSFGVIRPYKGIDDLIHAFDAIAESEIERYTLNIVGEVWEGQQSTLELARESRYAHRINVVDRYVDDDEMRAYFADADVVVLPYHRSSTSGPLNIAMDFGKPVVLTSVGGLIEGAGRYQGAVFCEPKNPSGLLVSIEKAAALIGNVYTNPNSWTATADRYALAFRGAVVQSGISDDLDAELVQLTTNDLMMASGVSQPAVNLNK